MRRTLDRGYFLHAAHPGEDFDLAALMSQQRRLTQQIAALVYELGYDGIRYQSRHGTDLLNWAQFEPYDLRIPDASGLLVEDADFINALHRLNLGLALNL